MLSSEMFGAGFAAGAALAGFAITFAIKADIAEKARCGATIDAHGRTYRFIPAEAWSRVNDRLRVALKEVDIMHRRENETLDRLKGGGMFTAAPTARPDAAHPENDRASLEQLDNRAAAARGIPPLSADKYDALGKVIELPPRGGLIEG